MRPDLRAVLDLDPIAPDHPLLAQPQATITPHIAFATGETLDRRLDECLDVLFAAARGEPVRWISGGEDAGAMAMASADLVAGRDRLLELASSFYDACTLHALIESGVLAHLEASPQRCADLASDEGLDEEALRLLLETCQALGLLGRDCKGAFGLTPAYAPLLAPGSPVYAGPMVSSVMGSSYVPWSGLPDFIRTGKPTTINQALREKSIDWARRLTHGSDSVSAPLTDTIAAWLGTPIARILDVGCGPATLTRHLLRRLPGATALLIDRRLPLDVCRTDFLEPEGLAVLCRLVEADMTDPAGFEGGQDLVLLMNVVHMLAPDEAAALVARAAQALAPGGQLLIESFLTDDADDESFARQFSLSCRLLSGRARGYGRQEVVDWIEAAGLRIQRAERVGRLTTAVLARRATDG